MMDLIWLVCLLITHIVAYFIGRNDGVNDCPLSDEAWVEVRKYEIDKKYAHMAWQWLEERTEKHDS